jgi:hypothetical protein
MSQEYLDKLEHIRGAVAHHVYEEEGNWFLDLKTKLSAKDQTKITFRYREEFLRYTEDPEAGDYNPRSSAASGARLSGGLGRAEN